MVWRLNQKSRLCIGLSEKLLFAFLISSALVPKSWAVYEKKFVNECVSPSERSCEAFREQLGNPEGPLYIVDRQVCESDPKLVQITCGWNVEAQDLKSCFMSQCLPIDVLGSQIRSSQDPCGGYYVDNNSYLVKYKMAKGFSVGCGANTYSGVIPGVQIGCCVDGFDQSFIQSTNGAEPNEFPHQVHLKMQTSAGQSTCGGTIYNEKWIITAAHCVVETVFTNDENGKSYQQAVNLAPEAITVYAGSNRFWQGEEYLVDKVITHSNYSRKTKSPTQPIIFNDVALLKLKKSIAFGPAVKALKIAPENFNPFEHSDTAIIAGWGRLQNFENPEKLSKAHVPLIDDDTCSQYYAGSGYPREIFNQLICVGGIVNGQYHQTASQGDSGGPAICRDKDGNAVLCGITSAAAIYYRCINENLCFPSVYVDVALFRNWIIKRAGVQKTEQLFNLPVFGIDTEANEYSNQVHITSSGGKPCGGTLISDDTVLTAAQCVYQSPGRKFKSIKITVGVHDIKKQPSAKHVFTPKKIAAHEDFQLETIPFKNTSVEVFRERFEFKVIDQEYFKNDIAIIKLDRSVGSKIKPAKLPRANWLYNTKKDSAVEVAWRRDLNLSSKLQKRNFTFIPRRECVSRLNSLSNPATGLDPDGTQIPVEDAEVELDKNVICAVEKYSGGSICDRELGGGVFCKHADGSEFLCGIQNFRLCVFALPNLFLDVRKHRQFIDQHLRK